MASYACIGTALLVILVAMLIPSARYLETLSAILQYRTYSWRSCQESCQVSYQELHESARFFSRIRILKDFTLRRITRKH